MKMQSLSIFLLICVTLAYIPSNSNLRRDSNDDKIINMRNSLTPAPIPDKDDKYTWTMKFINETITKDSKFRHHAYESTAYLVDTFGPRVLGTQSLEDSLKYMEQVLKMEGFENVRLEEVLYREKWTRGEEHLMLLSPRLTPVKLPMIGLGKSVGGNVTAEVEMANNWDEIKNKGESGLFKGKIAFLNPIWVNYEETVKYRKYGPSLTAKYGAVGCVIRSIAPKSIENPHTGTTYYDEKFPKIPSAATSLETADMLSRMITRGQKVILNLYMEAHFEEGNFVTHNLIGELTGSKYKDEILLLGGHIDSWDGGPQTGAEDDASGFMVCMEAVRLLIQTGLKPLRTIRFIAWTGEEFGSGPSKGAEAYATAHESEMNNHILAFESDMGVTDLTGFGYSGGAKGFNLMKMVTSLFFRDMQADTLNRNQGGSSDINILFKKHKIPIMKNLVQDTADKKFYFTYYHSSGDNMNILNPDEMDKNVSGIAALMYIIADVPWRLPRD